jgi:hypothetical protein
MHPERLKWKALTNKHGRAYGSHVKGKHTRGLFKKKR